MKKRWLILIILSALFIHITASTLMINRESYIALAREAVKNDKTIIYWDEAEVKRVNLNEKEQKQLFLPDGRGVGKINRYLLVLNGNNAVYVRVRTNMDALLGPAGFYFNPFTKVLVGCDIRM